MAASDVDIVNNALIRLGDNSITSLADNTVRARLANVLFADTRDAVLRAHPWNCAVNRVELGLLSAAPSHGWSYQFQLPADPYCLRVLALNDDEEDGDVGDTFRIEGRKLLTNSATAKIRFIGRITDSSAFDSLLYQAFILRLAAEMAYPVTGSVNVAASMWQLYEAKVKEARTVDGQEGSPDTSNFSTLLDVR